MVMDTLRELAEQHGVRGCSRCRSGDGMEEWLVGELRDCWDIAPETLYRLRGVDDALYTPCGECNGDGEVPAGYTRLEGDALLAFVRPSGDCDCNGANRDGCPICRWAARERYEGEIPF